MQVRKILVTAAAGVSLAGLAVTAAPGVAVEPAARRSSSAKTTLVTSSGTTVTPAAAAKLAGAAADVRGHDGHAPPSRSPRRPACGPNSVIGTDSRTQVTATTTFPNSAIVLINRYGSGCGAPAGWSARTPCSRPGTASPTAPAPGTPV